MAGLFWDFGDKDLGNGDTRIKLTARC
jgi:hypothetical protein